MGGIFSSPSLPAPPPTPAAPTREDPAVADARRKEQQLATKAKGRRSTLLTGGEGDSSDANLAKKTLLGG